MAGAVRVILRAVLLSCLAAAPLGAQTVGDPVASRSAEALEHYRAGRFEEALRAYRDALVERPESEGLHLNVGDALYQLGDHKGAAEEFERAGQARDARLAARALFNEGNAHFEMKDFAAAAAAYRRALERAPDDADAKANLELALRRIQPPPPSPQGGGADESEDQDEDRQPQPGQQPQPSGPQEPQGQPAPDPGPQEPQDASPSQASASQRPQGEGKGRDENQDREGLDGMEAQQLLDALRDREQEAQRRRFHAQPRGDDAKDW